MGHPTIYPAGVTVYDKDAACGGLTLISAAGGLIAIDMNGRPAGPPVSSPDGIQDGGAARLVCREEGGRGYYGKPPINTAIVETDAAGRDVWRWRSLEHFDELGFSQAAKNCIFRLTDLDWNIGGDDCGLKLEGATELGPNRLDEAGDTRFRPRNIAWVMPNANILGITDRETGGIVFRLGPTFGPETGWIIAPSFFRMIARELPGEGNFLVFDAGGAAGYGVPDGLSCYGERRERRDYSRVLEIDPHTLKIVWQYTPREAGHIHPLDSYKFYSPRGGSAQRLPNGNTLITEYSPGRVFEVTPEHRTVWEFVNPDFGNVDGLADNAVGPAVRVPYAEGTPPPQEEAVAPLLVPRYRVSGAPIGPGGKITLVAGVDPDRVKVIADPFEKVVAGTAEPSNFCVCDSGE
jgi:hypothetical protein